MYFILHCTVPHFFLLQGLVALMSVLLHSALYCILLPQGMVHAALTISSKEGGVAGLWRGAVPAVQRAALVNLGELATYDQVRFMWLEV